MPWIHRQWAPAAQVPFHWSSHNELLWVQQAGPSAEPKYLFLWFSSFSDHFPTQVSRSYVVLRMLNLLKTHINSPGKNLDLNLSVYSNAHRMLGDTAARPVWPREHLWGMPLGAVSIPLMPAIWLFLQVHLNVAKGTTLFSKRPRECIAATLPPSLYVGHCGEFLEVGQFWPKLGHEATMGQWMRGYLSLNGSKTDLCWEIPCMVKLCLLLGQVQNLGGGCQLGCRCGSYSECPDTDLLCSSEVSLDVRNSPIKLPWEKGDLGRISLKPNGTALTRAGGWSRFAVALGPQ